jgi:hypothetical protein
MSSAAVARTCGSAFKAILLLLAAAPASAALLQIGPSTEPFLTRANNNVLGKDVPMVDRATLSTTGAATLTFYFLGSESGYRNTLNLAGGFTHTEPANSAQTYPSAWPGTLLSSITVDAAGAVPMWFTSSGWSGGFQLSPGAGTSKRSIAFAYLDCTTGKGCAQTTTATNVVLFALDDDGANVDDDHDDYVGYLVADAMSVPQVPIPAAAWLLGSGLIGLLAVGRRRRADKVAG